MSPSDCWLLCAEWIGSSYKFKSFLYGTAGKLFPTKGKGKLGSDWPIEKMRGVRIKDIRLVSQLVSYRIEESSGLLCCHRVLQDSKSPELCFVLPLFSLHFWLNSSSWHCSAMKGEFPQRIKSTTCPSGRNNSQRERRKDEINCDKRWCWQIISENKDRDEVIRALDYFN